MRIATISTWKNIIFTRKYVQKSEVHKKYTEAKSDLIKYALHAL